MAHEPSELHVAAIKGVVRLLDHKRMLWQYPSMYIPICMSSKQHCRADTAKPCMSICDATSSQPHILHLKTHMAHWYCPTGFQCCCKQVAALNLLVEYQFSGKTYQSDAEHA